MRHYPGDDPKLALAKKIASRYATAAEDNAYEVHIALAAIEETTERAAKLADNFGQCSNTSGRGKCCETLGEDIALALTDCDHLKGPIE